jgi:membrane protease YdiL (CAAX protease family)
VHTTVTAPPPERPELPEGADPQPRWPAWNAPAAFGVGLVITFITVGILAAATGQAGSGNNSAAFTVIATLLQSVALVGAAILFASFTAPPKPWHFGLRRAPFWPTVGWAALGMFSFYVVSAIYTLLVHPTAKQEVTQDLGANNGTLGLIAAGVMVICVAPVAEELFFRGFFYKALRTRFVVAAAAGLDALVFGLIHYDFSGANALLILPPLAFLGGMFCLVYEKTGSLFPTIGLHAFNNTIAFGAQTHGWAVSGVVGPLMLTAVCLAPRVLPPARRHPVPGYK